MFNVFHQRYTYSAGGTNVLKLCKVISCMLLTAHYCACVWFIVGYLEYKQGKNSWIHYMLEMEDKNDIDDVTVFEQYSYSIYWSIITLLSKQYMNV